jgi:hypothetical protein
MTELCSSQATPGLRSRAGRLPGFLSSLPSLGRFVWANCQCRHERAQQAVGQVPRLSLMSAVVSPPVRCLMGQNALRIARPRKEAPDRRDALSHGRRNANRQGNEGQGNGRGKPVSYIPMTLIHLTQKPPVACGHRRSRYSPRRFAVAETPPNYFRRIEAQSQLARNYLRANIIRRVKAEFDFSGNGFVLGDPAPVGCLVFL